MKFIIALSLVLGACVHDPVSKDAQSSERLKSVINQYTEARKHLDAYDAPYFNIEADLAKFGDFGSKEYWKRAEAMIADALEQLKSVKADELAPMDKLTYRLFKGDLEVSLDDFKYPFQYLTTNQMHSRLHGFVDSASQALTIFPFDTVAHYDAFVKRAQGLPAYVDREIENLREGIKKNVTLSCTIVDRVPLSYKDALESDVEKNPFYGPVKFMPKTFAAEDQKRLAASFTALVRDELLPAYRKFDQFFKTEYRSHCRKGFGIASLPNGDAWYRQRILASTNLPLAPKEVHELGLREVARITAEMRETQSKIGFKGKLADFRKFLLKSPDSFFKNADELFRAFETTKGEIAKRIPKYFSLVPKSDFKIVSSTNSEDAAGSYFDPTDLHPYGRFVVNTIDIKAVPTYGVTTLLLHETVPGHHFQLALQFEAKDRLSEYQRKLFESNAFVEGWALYAEYLGNEMGLFDDPRQRFGRLNDEMLRAVRLVVDSGIHAMGWSQTRAIAYMSENLASDPKDIQNEVNRYSVWPGQALGYKIGQLKILELRRKAERELGPKFDIRGFHQAVIGNGTVSLGVLETQVDDWIASVKG